MFIKALIMGAPSAGKTRSASFYPRPIFADYEKGRMSLADRNVPYAEILTSRDHEEFLRHVEAECRKPPASRNYQTLVIDTLDAYQRMIIQERLKAERKEALSGFADWGHLDAKMVGFINRLLQLPMNLVVNVHVKETKDGDDGPVLLTPKLKGDIRESIAADFDLVGYMATRWVSVDGERTLKRTLQWHPDPKVPILKDRSGQLPKYTDVNFNEDDFNQIYLPIVGRLDDLTESRDLETIGSEDLPDSPQEGGPVPQGDGAARVMKAAKKAPAKKAAPPRAAEPQPEPRAVAKVTPKPEPEEKPVAEAVGEEATATPVVESFEEKTPEDLVREELGGEVIATSEDFAMPDITEPEPKAEPESQPSADNVCGTPTSGPQKPWAQDVGCGKDLATVSPDMVNIAVLKHAKKLCPACLKIANEKKKEMA